MVAVSVCQYPLSQRLVSDTWEIAQTPGRSDTALGGFGMQGARSAERTKMSLRMDPDERPRPHQIYKREFTERILALAPTSILDVGCGEAQLLRAAASGGCESCVGLEVDESLVSKHRNEGLDVRLGRAEALPFPDQSFDV